jgi:chromosomal replication initiation ATPase DnaA
MTTIERASALSGVPVSAIVGPSRLRAICIVRWAAMTALRRTGMSYPAIGRQFGRHHTTVMNGIAKGETYALFDDRYSSLVEALAA